MDGNVVKERQANPGVRSLGDVTAFRQEGGGLLLECGDARVSITPVTAKIIRVRVAPDGAFGRDHSWAVVTRGAASGGGAAAEDAAWRLEDGDDFLELATDAVHVRVAKRPCRINFLDSRGSLLDADCTVRGMTFAGEEVRCWKRLDGEDHFFGLGEKGSPLDKRGASIVNWNHDAAEHEPWTDPLYQTHPYVMVLRNGRCHGIFFDNPARSFFDFGKTVRDAWCFGADTGELNYYFIAGPAPADVSAGYAALVGTTPLPPLWALGYQQCRWSYPTAKRVREIAREFRDRDIPCDAIYVDIDYMDGFRSFTWDEKRFPNPRKLTKDLAAKGFKLVTILDPGIKAEPGYFVYDQGIAGDHFVPAADGKPYVGRVWPGESVWPDFSRAATRRWWGDLYKTLLDDGVSGIWNDMNEPADFTFPDGTVPISVRHDNDGQPTDHRHVHNVYGMQMARSTYEGLRRLRPDARPFVLTRAGYSGVQRYAAAWTGDNLSSWEHLRMSIPMLLNMNVSGVVFCGADIGGFRGYPSPELFTRWLQLGVFYPLMRAHTAGGKEQDPWSFGKKHEKYNRAAIELRYRLLPYLYTEFRNAARTGAPLLRPLFYDFPEHPKAHRVEHEFLFGQQLFVAPVVHEGAESRKLTLPAGPWYDFEDAASRVGGQEFEVPVEIDDIPMFARAGAVIPMREVRPFADEKPIRELTLYIYPGAGRGDFYNDDGASHEYQNGAFVQESYVSGGNGGIQSLLLESRDGDERFAPRSYLLRFGGIEDEPAAVALAGAPLTVCKSPEALAERASGWCYEKKRRIVWVRVGRLKTGELVEVVRRERKAGRSSAGKQSGQSAPR